MSDEPHREYYVGQSGEKARIGNGLRVPPDIAGCPTYGLKGTMSEYELSLLRQRGLAARDANARLHTVAAAGHLPTATDGGSNSYTTPGDTTKATSSTPQYGEVWGSFAASGTPCTHVSPPPGPGRSSHCPDGRIGAAKGRRYPKPEMNGVKKSDRPIVCAVNGSRKLRTFGNRKFLTWSLCLYPPAQCLGRWPRWSCG